MTKVTQRTVQCLSPAGLHSVAYKEWGDPDNQKVLVCVHGLTRVSGDFDVLAEALSQTYRVVCPDIVGRGKSGWLRDPQYYTVPQYAADMVTLIARLNVPTVDFIGTSMGGLIGMALASLPDSPIGKLVINDIGPELNGPALKRIGEYIGQAVRFDTYEEGAQLIRSLSQTFGPHTEAQWDKLAGDVLMQDKDGKWIRNYDLGLAVPYQSMTEQDVKHNEAMLWAVYDAIRSPTLLVRGKQSDMLTEPVAKSMTERGPRARLVELDGIGHAPTFVQADQVAMINDFLLGE
jgi:pimeloyl-ACP methyl ester carboxylesterase